MHLCQNNVCRACSTTAKSATLQQKHTNTTAVTTTFLNPKWHTERQNSFYLHAQLPLLATKGHGGTFRNEQTSVVQA